MDLIDEFASRESITKAAVITKALDCLKASYESGGITASPSGASEAASTEEVEALKAQLANAESKAEDATRQISSVNSRLASAEQARDSAEARANEAFAARDAAEAKLRDVMRDLSDARDRANQAHASQQQASGASEEELNRLRKLVSKQDRTIAEKSAALESRIAEKNAEIAERDNKISALSEQLGAANAKAELALKNINVEAVTIGDPLPAEGDESTRALAMLNMIGGVMNAFQQQVDDARAVGEQEGRMAVRKELQEMVEKARNDGYRDAMGYLDDRVTTARDSGAREERARIANMTFFERRRYLRMHIA